MKRNLMMKVLAMIATVVALTGCGNQSAEDISAVINNGTQVVEAVGNDNADIIEKEVKTTEDAGTGSDIRSTAAEKSGATLTAEEDAPEATTEPKATAEPEATAQPEPTLQPKPATQSEPTQKPEPTNTQKPEKTTESAAPVCEHDYAYETRNEIYEENCTGRSDLIGVCKKCGHEEVINTTGVVENHIYGEVIWVTYPTCTTPGEQYHICKNCGKEEEHYTVPPVPGNHNYVISSTSVVEPGCPNSQRLVDVTYVCSLCGNSHTEREIETATEHYDGDGDGKCDYCRTACGEPAVSSEPQPETTEAQTADSQTEPQPVDNTQSGTE